MACRCGRGRAERVAKLTERSTESSLTKLAGGQIIQMHSWRAERSTSRAVAKHARKQQQSMGSAASQIGLNYFSVHGTERHAWFVGEEHYIGVWRTGDAAAVHATVHLKKRGESYTSRRNTEEHAKTKSTNFSYS